MLDEVDERGVLAALAEVGLVTVAERLGKYPGAGRGSDATGASSGVVMEVDEDDVEVGEVSLSSVVPDRKEDDEVMVLRSGALYATMLVAEISSMGAEIWPRRVLPDENFACALPSR